MALPLSDESISNKVEKLVLLWDRPGVTSGDAGGDAGGTVASPSPACSAIAAGSGAGAKATSPTRQGDRGKSSGAAGGWPRSGPRLGPLPRPGLTARLFPALASGNLDKQTAKGSTALHYCCLTDNAECLKLLLRGKASIEIGERHRPAPGRRRAEAAAVFRRRAPPTPPRVPQGAGSALQRRRPFSRRQHRGHRVGTGAGTGPAAVTEAVDLPQVGGRALLSLTHTPDQPGRLVCCGGRCSLCLPPPGTLRCWRSAGRAQSSPRAAGCDEPRGVLAHEGLLKRKRKHTPV